MHRKRVVSTLVGTIPFFVIACFWALSAWIVPVFAGVSISITASPSSIPVGGTTTITVTYVGSGGAGASLSATGGTLSTNFIPAPGGNATFTATPGFSGVATVTAMDASGSAAPASVSINVIAPTTTTVPPTITIIPPIPTTVATIANSSLSGRVLIDGVGAAGVSVRLAGGDYQQTDATGAYSFSKLSAGSYQPVVLIETAKYSSSDNFAKATDVDGYVHSSIALGANQDLSDINFNLTSVNTATTTAPATTSTPSSPTVPAIPTATPSTSPTTEVAGPTDFAGCVAPAPPADVLSFSYCTAQSPTDPNEFRVNVVVNNNTAGTIDLANTLIFNLQAGSQVRAPSVSTGQVSASNDSGQLSWRGFQLAPGQSANLSFYISKAANSLTLVKSINITGINRLLNSPFTAVLPAILAKAGSGQEVINPGVSSTVSTGGSGGSSQTGPGLPHTGTTPNPAQSELNLTPFIMMLLGLLLGGGCVFGLWKLRAHLRTRQE